MSTTDGPKTNATKTSYVKFHDDKKLYTGVYKRRSDVKMGKDDVDKFPEHLLHFDSITHVTTRRKSFKP